MGPGPWRDLPLSPVLFPSKLPFCFLSYYVYFSSLFVIMVMVPMSLVLTVLTKRGMYRGIIEFGNVGLFLLSSLFLLFQSQTVKRFYEVVSGDMEGEIGGCKII
jgi:hypothetical protein